MLIRFLTKEESKTVKMIMQFQLPPDKFNEAVLDGTAGQKMAKIMETLKPETAYYTARDGKRGGIYIIELDDPSQIPFYAEPFFLYFDAQVEFFPFMTPEDLMRSGLDELGRTWS